MQHNYALTRTCLIICITLLLAFGLAMMYSTTAPVHGHAMLIKQSVFIVAGLFVAFMASRLDYRFLCKKANLVLIAAGALILPLTITFILDRFFIKDIHKSIPIAHMAKGAARWYKLGPISLQPAEFVKLAIIIFLGAYFQRNQNRMGHWKYELWKPSWRVGVVLGLVLLTGSLSFTSITIALVAVIYFVAGVRLRWFAPLAMVFILGFGLILLGDENRMNRWKYMSNPEEFQMNQGYQLWNSWLALGSGGLTGKGFTESRMKNKYLPEAHTDCILSIAGEELGFMGILFVVGLYVGLLLIAIAIARQACDVSGMLIASGIGVALSSHAFINIGVISGFLPTTGITAPFISYGGSSMVSGLLAVGLLFSINRTSERANFDTSLAEKKKHKTWDGRIPEMETWVKQ